MAVILNVRVNVNFYWPICICDIYVYAIESVQDTNNYCNIIGIYSIKVLIPYELVVPVDMPQGIRPSHCI